MLPRRQVVLLFAAALAAMGAQFPTPNFVVEAPTPQVAQQVGQMAEYYRRQKALEWLGQEMPAWGERCPIKVKVTMGGAGGATSFAFDRGQVLGQSMHIEGSLDRLLASVLPHEVTHTVFAYRFRSPVPRWADEGGSVLSEDEAERNRHDQLVRQILNEGRAIPLRRLFALKEYPRDVMCLYAQGYSVSNFLVSSSSRPAFLAFIGHGMQYGWDNAVQVHYRYQNVEELEQAWLAHLRGTKRQPPGTILAKNNQPATVDTAQRTIVRLTAPPAQPLQDLPAPVYRGQSPENEPLPARPPSASDGWQPATTPAPTPTGSVRLGRPQIERASEPPSCCVPPAPAPPPGYPR